MSITTREGFLSELALHIRARYPVILLLTWEEERVGEMIADVAGKLGKAVYVWTSTEGLRRQGGKAPPTAPGAPVTPVTAEDPEADKPIVALERVATSHESALFVFEDLHPHLDDPVIIRRLRDLVSSLRESRKTILLVSPVLKVPDEMEKDVVVLEVPLPDGREIGETLDRLIASVQRDPKYRTGVAPDLRERMVQAARGLTAPQARQAFTRALVNDQKFGFDDLEILLSEKRQMIRKTGILEYYDLDESIGNVGGLDLLKAWLESRQDAFGDRARGYGLPQPKGLLLLGVQGCGKSLCAKAIAAYWKIPLLRLDIGTVFSMYVGSSEERMRRALRIAESLAPVVLWVDEIEKGFSGIKGGGGGDSGASARVFGTFLTWMQEKTQPVFVVATANAIADLPPELLRKGRFDEIYFVDLPTAKERRQIFEIHLTRRKRDPARFDLAALTALADGFSGAEIEQAIVSAMYRGFATGREFTTEDILQALGETVPLSRTMREEIDGLREWASDRARPATRGDAP